MLSDFVTQMVTVDFVTAGFKAENEFEIEIKLLAAKFCFAAEVCFLAYLLLTERCLLASCLFLGLWGRVDGFWVSCSCLLMFVLHLLYVSIPFLIFLFSFFKKIND
jgi:hypothetical protein